MNGLRLLGIMVGVLLAVAGCSTTVNVATEQGSGTSVTESRATGSFEGLRVEAGIVADISIGAPLSVAVTADDNLLDNVVTAVEGQRLDVRVEGSVSTKHPIKVAIVVPHLDAIEATSAAVIRVTGLECESLHLLAESSGRIVIDGHATELDLRGNSAGQAELGELAVGSATVSLESAAQARLNVADDISGSVTTAAVLRLVDQPSTVDVDTDAAGVVVTE